MDFNQNHSAEQSREDREPSTSAAAAGKSRPAEATTAGGNEGGSSAKKRRKAPEFTSKYDPNYLKLGFTWCGTESEPVPQCVLCSQTLSNGCMKPAHLKRHLQTKHAKYKDKPLQFFKNKLASLNEAKSDIASASTPVCKAQECSFRASLRIAKAGKSHTIGEELCLPMAKEMTRIMCGGKMAKRLDMIPLSTVKGEFHTKTHALLNDTFRHSNLPGRHHF